MGWKKLEETGKAAYKVCVHTKMYSFASPILHTFSQRHASGANHLPESLHLDNVKWNVRTGCKKCLLNPFKLA